MTDPICRECNAKPCVCAQGDDKAVSDAAWEAGYWPMKKEAEKKGIYKYWQDAGVVLRTRVEWEELKQRAERAEAVLPCGHPVSLLIKSVESEHQFCELCDTYDRRNDAEQRERELMAERDALTARLAAAEAEARRYRWLRENPNFMGWEHDFLDTQVDAAIDAAIAQEKPNA